MEQEEKKSKISIIFVTPRKGAFDKYVDYLKRLDLINEENTFHEVVLHENNSIEELFIEVWNLHPKAIVFDFNHKDDLDLDNSLYYLAKLVRGDAKARTSKTIGLHDQSGSEGTIKRALSAGIRYNLIRGGDVDYNAEILKSLLEDSLEPLEKFIKVQLNDPSALLQDLRIGYATNEYFRVETNTTLELNEEISIVEHRFENFAGMIPVSVQKEDDMALYYGYRVPYKLVIKYYEMPLYDKNWITEIKNSVLPKKNRLLVIDPSLKVYANSFSSLERLPYTLKIQTSFDDIDIFLERFRPELIALQMSEDENLNKEMIQNINSRNLSIPKIIFGNQGKLIKEIIQESHYLSIPGDICFKLLSDLSFKMTEKSPSINPKAVFFGHLNEKSIISFKRDINLVAINEHILEFETKHEIPFETVLKMQHLEDFHITVISCEFNAANKSYTCKGIIHSISEDSISSYRSFINKVVFRDKEKEKAKELEEFKKLNEQKKSEGSKTPQND